MDTSGERRLDHNAGYLLEWFPLLMTANLDRDFQIELVQEADKPFLTEPVKARAHDRGDFGLLDTEKP